MTPRTLRCANAHLYLGFVALILAAAAYALFCRELRGWELWGTLAACTAGVAWGCYYIGLKFELDETGVSRCLFGVRMQRIAWLKATLVDVQEARGEEIESCTITVSNGKTTLLLSSDLLPLDEVQRLAADMREEGLVCPRQAEN